MEMGEAAEIEKPHDQDDDLPGNSATGEDQCSRRGSCTSACSNTGVGQEPYPMPSRRHVTSYMTREPSSGRRKCASAVLREEEIGAKLHVLGEHLDAITERLDQMELHLKLKVKEVAQEQSRHLTQEIQSTTATEAYET